MSDPTEDDLDSLMDDMQVLYTLRAGHTVSQGDVDALNRLDDHWREDGERVLDAYHRGWREGVEFAGSADLLEMEDRLGSFRVQHATDKYMRKLTELREAELLEALKQARDLLLERKHGNPARSAGHNARLIIQAAIAKADGE